MSVYLIVRRWRSMSDAEDHLDRMRAAAQPDGIGWDHTHVAEHETGELTSFCVYEAPSAAVLHDHIASLGGFELEGIYPISAELAPDRLASRERRPIAGA